MKVSLNTIRQFIDFELPSVEEVVAKINAQLGQVDNVIDLSEQYKDVTVVNVVSCEKHPNADRLSVCLVDDGGVVNDVERDENGLVRVVCGAPNVHADMYAAWLPPRATVPASFGTAEPFVLDARELRGLKSNGMLAAADELALGGDHGGIIEIDPNEQRPYKAEIKPGASFAACFGLDDQIIDIENKMFTHRPDLFGQLGVAREIAGILGHQFKSPAWYLDQPAFAGGGGLKLDVFNEAGDKCSRFTAVALKDVTVGPSPLWLQIELVRLGGKPINNIVDATNYVMLLTAQPTHAYDYDKLRGGTLGVRMAQAGERCSLLNGKSYELTADDVVIVDGEGIVGLGGVMGGGNSEVSAETKNVVLECATFDMYAVRKTSMRYGLFTDAVTRFNKGQSPLQQLTILSLLTKSVIDASGGSQASDTYDVHAPLSPSPVVRVESRFVTERLGLPVNGKRIADLLGLVEFDLVDIPPEVGERLEIGVPFWRTDIELPEDIVEEIGRLHGFDKLPRELPRRSISPAPENTRRVLKQRIREALRHEGANEVLTYSFVHERVLASAGQDVSHAYRLSNALSPELQYYRLSLLPSLLDKVRMDIKAGFDEFALFEIGKAHSKVLGLNAESLPQEPEFVEMVFASKRAYEDAPYYQVRCLVDGLLKALGVDPVYKPISEPKSDDAWAPFELSRSAVIETSDGTYLGIVGELASAVRAKFKLPEYVAGFSVSVDALESLTTSAQGSYIPLSRYPSTSQDISLRITTETPYSDLYQAVRRAASAHGNKIAMTLEPVSIYRAESDSTHKTVTFHLTFTSSEQTLQDGDVNPIMNAVAAAAHDELGAERV